MMVYIHTMMGYEAMAQVIAAECTCQRARRAARALTKAYDELLRPLSLEATQLGVLAAVAHFGEAGAQIGGLADALGLDRTTLTRNLVPLEKAGLIRVARSPTDARARIVLLTRAGERAIEEAFPLWQEAQQRVHDTFGKGRTEAIRSDLGDLVTRLTGAGKASAGQRRRAK
jgi:DNA-binding MarR family transcriptional regulator